MNQRTHARRAAKRFLRLVGAPVAALCLLGLGTAPAAAQLTTGTIAGTVTDDTGAVLPGVAVTIKNLDTGLSRTLVTNERGRFEAPNLAVGPYEVTASLQGFTTSVRRGITLAVGRTAVVDHVLKVGGLEEQLVVTGDAPLVETSSATVSTLINSQKVEDLPLVNRDLTQLTFMQPGVLKIPSSGDQGVFSGMGDKFSIAGARGTQNLYLLDGVSNADLSGNAQGASGSYGGSETVAEIQIITNNYSAEYRSAAGGIVSAITKSGTNALHGSAFEFFRDDALDALNYFDKKFDREKPDFRRNMFGGSVGGPIRQNRMFFFGSYEGLREDYSVTDTATVLSANARQGRLANGRTVAVNPAIQRYVNLYPVPGQGNTIVQDFGDSVLIAGTLDRPTRNTFALGKLDYHLSPSNQLQGTYNFDKGDRSPYGVLGDLTATGTRSKKHVVSTKLTTVMSSAALNELHFGYSDAAPAGDLPISTLDLSNLVFRSERTLMGQVVVPGLGSIGYRTDASFYETKAYTLKDAYSLIRGNHSLRAGGEWTYFQNDVESCSRGCNGIFEFGSVADLLQAIPRRFEVMLSNDTKRDLRQHLVGVYFQDNWKIKPAFTLNLGLRYELATTITEVNDKLSNLIDFFDKDVTLGSFYKNPATKAFSPRIGFAWSPRQGRASLRGGVGVFYEHPTLYNVRTSLQELPPFTLTGRIDRRDAQARGQEINFPNAYQTQINLARGRPNIRTMQYELDQTYFVRWNVTWQQQFWEDWMYSVDVTASRGRHLWQQSLPNINRWQGWPEQPAPGTKFFPAGSSLINPNFGEMRIQYTNADADYNGASLGLNRRLANGLQAGAAFTFSKTVDEGSGVTSNGDELPQSQRGIYAWDMYLKRGPSSYDVRKAFSANLTYQVPGQGALAGGWQVNSVITLTDGYWLSVGDASTAQAARIGDDEDLRPDLVPGGNNNPVTGDPERWFDASQFSPSRLGYFGNVGRNTVESPGLATVDLSLFKNFGLPNQGRLQFRMEIFNLFDRANFGTPDMTAFINGQPNPAAGRITRTRTPARQMQFGVRWVF